MPAVSPSARHAYRNRIPQVHKRPTVSRLATAAIVLCLVIPPATATADPLFDQPDGPFAGLFGWPNSTEGAQLTRRGTNRLAIRLAAASHSVDETAGGESIVLDGETTRVWLDGRRGITDRLEVGILVPWVWHHAGSMDSLIRGWHDFFGLPQGNRAGWPEDRLRFELSAANGETFRLDQATNGPGDLRLFGGWLLGETTHARTALRLGLKLPTGDSSQLLGSGAADFSVGLAGDLEELFGVTTLSGFYRLTALRLGANDLSTPHNRRLAGALSGGLTWRWSPRVSLTAQTSMRSAAFRSAVAPLGDWAMSLTAGSSFRLSPTWHLSLAVTEDVKVGSVPDVAFLLGFSRSGS